MCLVFVAGISHIDNLLTDAVCDHWVSSDFLSSHTWQVRYSQLTKQQEKMIRDMEAAVSRRETIMIRGESQSKMDKKHVTKSDVHHGTQELRKKIKETQKVSR